jgi:predicted transcriptional regulator
MRRTTIMADDALLDRLREIAAREDKSLATVIREGLELRVRRDRPPLTFIGAFASGHTDTSERVDELIHEWLSRQHDR